MIGNSPVAISELIKQAVSNAIKLLIVFGILAWSGEQTAIVLIVVDSMLALVAGIWTWRNVTPIANPTLAAGTSVRVEGTENVTVVGGPESVQPGVDPFP